jgi:hypothetical protein
VRKVGIVVVEIGCIVVDVVVVAHGGLILWFFATALNVHLQPCRWPSLLAASGATGSAVIHPTARSSHLVTYDAI